MVREKNVTSAFFAIVGTVRWIAKDGRRPVASIVVFGAVMSGSRQSMSLR